MLLPRGPPRTSPCWIGAVCRSIRLRQIPIRLVGLFQRVIHRLEYPVGGAIRLHCEERQQGAELRDLARSSLVSPGIRDCIHMASLFARLGQSLPKGQERRLRVFVLTRECYPKQRAAGRRTVPPGLGMSPMWCSSLQVKYRHSGFQYCNLDGVPVAEVGGEGGVARLILCCMWICSGNVGLM